QPFAQKQAEGYERTMGERVLRKNITFKFLAGGCALLCAALVPVAASAQETAAKAPPANEDVLGEFVVTGTAQEHIPKIAILPSLSPALEDVIVRSVVRRDLDLSG